MKNINSILKMVLEEVEPKKEEMKSINALLRDFLKKIKKKTSLNKIKAEIFVGGSFAKKTVIKKDHYDIDIFLRFDKKYANEKLSDITSKILQGIKNQRIHGSRDYFRINLKGGVFVELIPVRKITNLKQAENITDLSYSHVKYIRKKIKSKKILEDIMLAKAFAYACHCYGAESYIKGFSGYSLELLVYYYKGFLPFIKAMTKIKGKEVVDIERQHKNKQSILMDLNEAKLNSPIVLIDPTFKQRNALAALSGDTFERFQKACREFLKNPSPERFKIKLTDVKKIKGEAGRKGLQFILLQAKTEKQEGDIAGSKLLKFYYHLTEEIRKKFEIKKKGFNYNRKQSSRYFFVVKEKKPELIKGPNTKDKENVKAFEKKHGRIIIKNGRVCAKEKPLKDIKVFLKKWFAENKDKIKDMSIKELKITNS